MDLSSPLCGSLLSGGSPLKDPLRPLELGASSRAEVLSAAIDEILNHPDSGPDAARRHILACHGSGDLGGRPGERPCRRVRGIRSDASYPPPLPRPSRCRGRWHRFGSAPLRPSRSVATFLQAHIEASTTPGKRHGVAEEPKLAGRERVITTCRPWCQSERLPDASPRLHAHPRRASPDAWRPQ
jgi:hypothetical protein